MLLALVCLTGGSRAARHMPGETLFCLQLQLTWVVSVWLDVKCTATRGVHMEQQQPSNISLAHFGMRHCPSQ
jgi:hypothetical protein